MQQLPSRCINTFVVERITALDKLCNESNDSLTNDEDFPVRSRSHPYHIRVKVHIFGTFPFLFQSVVKLFPTTLESQLHKKHLYTLDRENPESHYSRKN